MICYQKIDVYRRNRVQEYVVWIVNEQRIEWHVWSAGRYEQMERDSSGIFHSRVLPASPSIPPR